MSHRERAGIYALLTALLVVNVVVLCGRAEPEAHAAPSFAADRLGPAAAIELEPEGEGKPLVLQNRDGRLSWSESKHDRVYTTGYVYIGAILRQLMQSEALEEEKAELVAELNEQEAEFRARLEAVGNELQSMDPESDEARQTYERGSKLYQEYDVWRQQALNRRGKLDAEQLETAYREMVEAVQIVAEKKGVDTVYRFIPTDEPFRADNPDQAMTAIRLRSALRYPDDLDLTPDVLEELALDTEDMP
jgi:Skp family chaperone for outer membrane proteins